jgi:phosphoribosylaminoimidazolecarboxamide formyltransferase / IMP cyclohydrolase
MTDLRPIRRALLSVWYKDGLEDLARALHAAGVELVSTGNTAAFLDGLGLPVTRVEQLTGFPESLDGRVKTLHPKVHAGLLADLRLEKHRSQLDELGIEPFDLLVSNLYPFTETVAAGGTEEEIVEKIDIGGPAMVRSAAKNHASVAVVTDPASYPLIIAALSAGGTGMQLRRSLAARAFADIAAYDVAIAQWCTTALSADESGWPQFTGQALTRSAVLRYGENPHQRAALYTDAARPAGLAQAVQVTGKEMSYNNYVDADAAWRACNDFAQPCVAIIKHANPCGIAVGADVAEAHRKAFACDPQSAYGGVVAANVEVTNELVDQLKGVFTEVLVAPSYAPDALERLKTRKNTRVLIAPEWTPESTESRQVSGGMLVQGADRVDASGDDPATWTLVSGQPADEATLADLAFAWRAIRSVKSNAILLASDGASVGVGMGQVNRVDSCRLAVARAGERAKGSVGASDAYFPFADGLQILLDAGVSAIVEPGGSIRDEEVVAAAQAAGITLYFTGTRHFFH